MKLNAVQMWR